MISVEEDCDIENCGNHDENNNTIELDHLDFSCEFTDNLPQVFKSLNISLAFTSYQAGRLMFVRSDGNSLDINYKSFHRPMGLSVTESGLTLGVFTQVVNFQRVDGLVEKLKTPLQKIEDDVTAPRINTEGERIREQLLGDDKNTLGPEEREELEKAELAVSAYQDKLHEPVDDRVDSCFMARSSHYTGMINLHDIDWGDEGLWVVNSSFSCLCTLGSDYSFVPRWKPNFISELVPEDRCHLNGMGLRDGAPAYVTTFSTYNEMGMWRKGEKHLGTLIDVETNDILLGGLTMPHSPRWHQERVYYCNSGLGAFCSYDPSNGKQQTIAELQGFTRGLDFYGPIAFVGLSKVRTSNVLNPPPLSQKYNETFSGIWLINLIDNTVIGHIKFTGNVDQIYDVAIIPNSLFPELLEPTHPRMRNHFYIP